MSTGSQAKSRTTSGNKRSLLRGGLLIVLMILPFVSAAALLHMYNSSVDPPVAPPSIGSLDNIVRVGNGVTMQADKGTVGRDLVDWLNEKRGGSRLFAVGGHQFEPHTELLTSESKGRLLRLAAMLRANKDVSARIIAYSNRSSSFVVDDQRPKWRVRAVVDELVGDGIPANRLTSEIQTSSEPPTPDHRVAIMLIREQALER